VNPVLDEGDHLALHAQALQPRRGEKGTSGRKRREVFRRLAHRTSAEVGHPWAFAVALGIILFWGASGPLFHFSDTWQLVINTGTTIVTFLMVFLIQNTQNRDSHEVHLKLDELIRANRRARNRLMGLDALTDDELTELEGEFMRLAREKIAERDSHPRLDAAPPSSR